ncbi:unnamed protein product, partial [Polarella glacialis]
AMSWLTGGLWGAIVGSDVVAVAERQDGKPMPKTAARKPMLPSWETGADDELHSDEVARRAAATAQRPTWYKRGPREGGEKGEANEGPE